MKNCGSQTISFRKAKGDFDIYPEIGTLLPAIAMESSNLIRKNNK